MLRVLQDNGWAGKVQFVGFDASDEPGEGAARRRTSTASCCRIPVNMGYLGVKTMVAHIKGEPVEKRIDTGVHLVTREQHGRRRR